jgi:hypothetical protein
VQKTTCLFINNIILPSTLALIGKVRGDGELGCRRVEGLGEYSHHTSHHYTPPNPSVMAKVMMRRRSTTSTENRENQSWKRAVTWVRRMEDSKMAVSDDEEWELTLLTTGRVIQELWWIQEQRKRRMEESTDSDDSVNSEGKDSSLDDWQEKFEIRRMLSLYQRLYPELTDLALLAERGISKIDETEGCTERLFKARDPNLSAAKNIVPDIDQLKSLQ